MEKKSISYSAENFIDFKTKKVLLKNFKNDFFSQRNSLHTVILLKIDPRHSF